LDWIAVTGVGSWSGLGGEGCGLATTVSFALMLIAAHWVFKHHPKLQTLQSVTPFNTKCNELYKTLLTLGLPAAFALLAEVSLFMLLALLIVPFGVTALAAHQIAINITTLLYVAPFSLATVLAIEAGRLHGLKANQKLKQFVLHSLLACALLGGLMSLITWTGYKVFPTWFTQDQRVIHISANLLLFAVAYQIADAIQMGAAALAVVVVVGLIVYGLYRAFK
jgi:MATE family multidrug resistance protein